MITNKPISRAWATTALMFLLLSATSIWAASSDLDKLHYNSAAGAYEISSESDFQAFASYINGASGKGITFRLTSNIVLYRSFAPIGSGNFVFSGTFDGNGHYITTHDSINYLVSSKQERTESGSGTKNVIRIGLFTTLPVGATVKNLEYYPPSKALSTASETSLAEAYYGGIAAYNRGTISSCQVRNSQPKITLTAAQNYFGGIAGHNEGTISSSTFYASLKADLKSGAKNYVGGMAGLNDGSIKNNTVSASITLSGGSAYYGGVAGINYAVTTGVVDNYVEVYKAPTISGSTKGAIVGFNDGKMSNNGYKTGSTGIGTSSGDILSNNGAVPVYTISAGSGVSVTSSAMFMRGSSVRYYGYNSRVTFNYGGVSAATGYAVSYKVKTSSGGNVEVTLAGTQGTITMPASDITIERKDRVINYIITYNLYGGTNPSNAPTSYNITNNALTLPTPTKDGSVFDGWYTSSDFSGSKVTSIPHGSYGNKTFYAKWKTASYTITYYLNGGTNASNAKTSYTSEEVDFNLPSPTKTGYVFAGWYTNNSFTDSKVTKITYGSSGNKEFYAKWTPITYTVKFYSNDATIQTTTQEFTYDEEQKLDANPFTPATGNGGFIAWNTNMTGNGTTYSDGASVKNLASTLGETVHLFAQWKKHIAYASDIYIYPIKNICWTGKPIEPTVTIVKNKTTDISDDFIITYSNNINVGEATVTITVDTKKNSVYDGSTTIKFNITKVNPFIEKPTEAYPAYNGEAQALVTAGTTNYGTMLYSLDGVNYSEEIPTAVNAGEYKVYFKVEEGENYNGTEGFLFARIEGKYTKNEFVEINEIDGKKYVTIDGDGESDKPFEIKEDIVVENVKLTREFTFGPGYSTLVLPFEVNTKQLTGVSKILEFTGMGVNDKGVKQVEMSVLWDKDKPHVKIEANKPYMIQMESATLGVDGEVTLKKTETPIATVPNSDWKFVGTYQYKKWESGDPQLGHAYGFAGTPKGELSAGEFVKVGVGTYINPMRAYLLAPTFSGLKKASYVSSTASIENSFPDSIEVVVVDKEHTTVIGTFSTVTGQFKMNRNYDLKGRNLQGKSKARGAYYGKMDFK